MKVLKIAFMYLCDKVQPLNISLVKIRDVRTVFFFV